MKINFLMPFIKLLDSLIIVILFFVDFNYSQILKPEQLYQKVLPSIMTLNVTKSDGSKWVGSSFLSIDEGIGITAYHVIQNAIKVTAKFSDGEEFDVSGIIDKDEKRDLALIRIKLFGKPKLELEKNESMIGSEVYIVGAPLGLEFSITSGLLSQIQNFEGIKVYQFSCPASQGNSGCPLINSNGKVIGVVSFGLIKGNDLNFAIPYNYVLGLDKSLPTQPFPSTLTNISLDNIKKVDEEKFIEEIANALSIEEDFIGACGFLRQIATYDGSNFSWGSYQGFDEPGYTYPIPPFYYSFKKKIRNQINSLEYMRIDNNLLTKTKEKLLLCLKDLIEYSDLIEEAFLTAKKHNGWEYEASDLFSRADAIVYKRDFGKEIISKLLLDSTNISDLFSDDMKDFLDIERKYPNYFLGVIVFNSETTKIELVFDNSLAKEIGLLRNDNLLEINGIKLSSQSQFKKYLYEFRGQEIKVTVLRSNQKEILETTVPSLLPYR
jgi:S1-C subfamily serine protease